MRRSSTNPDPDRDFMSLLEEDPDRALSEARDWIADEPTLADAHYAAALAYEALGRRDDEILEALEVLRLDAQEPPPPADLERLIQAEAEATLENLPALFRDKLGPVAILVEPAPSEDLVRSGIDPRLLGFFEGATSEELSSPNTPPVMTRIVLFARNLAASCPDDETLRKEVAITVLHEIGHFFGLEEHDMVRLGLD